jgi:hypothetical protein
MQTFFELILAIALFPIYIMMELLGGNKKSGGGE